MQRLFALMLAALALGAAACGPNPGGKLPVSSPVYSFQPPDAEDFEEEPPEDDTEPPADVEQDAE